MQQILEKGTQKQIQNVNYEIVELIGYGAQSLIYKVTVNPNQSLVMKHMRNCDAGMIEILEKLKKQQFRNVLNIISYEACNQQPPYTDLFITSELLQFTLENFKDEIDYQMIIQQSFIGLGEIFDMGASHNDIKPDNIFLSIDKDRSLNLKIGDFGLLSFEKQTRVEYYLQQGTLFYRAPEIKQCQDLVSLQQKQANDIWGLGLTLYYALTKENFYEQNQIVNLVDQSFIEQRVSKVDKKYQQYINGCLNLDHSKRLQYFNDQYNHLILEYSILNQTIQKIKIYLRREYQKPQPELYHKILKYLDNQQIAEQKNINQKEKINELQQQIQQIIQDDVQEQFKKIVQQSNK